MNLNHKGKTYFDFIFKQNFLNYIDSNLFSYFLSTHAQNIIHTIFLFIELFTNKGTKLDMATIDIVMFAKNTHL